MFGAIAKALGTWIVDQIRSLFFTIDMAIYGVANMLYTFLMKLSTLEIFSESTIQQFATRIYALLGVIMIFKLTVSMVQYVAEPEKLESDGKKLVTNIIIALVLMVILPGIIFPVSRNLQNALLKDQLIEKIILGIDESGIAGKRRKATGNIATYAAFSSFFYPAACEGMPVFVSTIGSDGESEESSFTEECVSAINSAGGTSIQGFEDLYLQSYEQKDITALGLFVNEKNDDDDYIFKYHLLVSTAVGAILAFMFFRFCFDIALRAVKLGFLQLIAPIPIISYADPKSKRVFDSYIKEYINTYLSLFMRLAALFFAVTVIQLLTQNTMYYYDFETGQDMPVNGFMMQLFIIVGALMFASEVPKLLEKLLGISGGNFSLNPFKNSPLANAVVGGAVAGTAAGITNTFVSGAERYRDNRILGMGRGRALAGATGRGVTSAVGGFFGAGRRAFMGGLHGEKFGRNVWNAHQTAMFARQQREDLTRQGSTAGGRARADLNRHVGRMNAAQRQQYYYDRAERQIKTDRDNYNGRKRDYDSRKADLDYQKSQDTRDMKEYQMLMQQVEARINQDKNLQDAQKNLEYQKSIGDKAGIERETKNVKAAKKAAANSYFSSTDSEAIRSRMNQLRANDTRLQSPDFAYSKVENGQTVLNGSVKDSLARLVWDTEQSYEGRYRTLGEEERRLVADDRLLSQRERELQLRKTNPNYNVDENGRSLGDWNANSLDNSSRATNSPQREGWMPSWGYGPSGYMGYPGGPGGPAGGPPPPPGNGGH